MTSSFETGKQFEQAAEEMLQALVADLLQVQEQENVQRHERPEFPPRMPIGMEVLLRVRAETLASGVLVEIRTPERGLTGADLAHWYADEVARVLTVMRQLAARWSEPAQRQALGVISRAQVRLTQREETLRQESVNAFMAPLSNTPIERSAPAVVSRTVAPPVKPVRPDPSASAGIKPVFQPGSRSTAPAPWDVPTAGRGVVLERPMPPKHMDDRPVAAPERLTHELPPDWKKSYSEVWVGIEKDLKVLMDQLSGIDLTQLIVATNSNSFAVSQGEKDSSARSLIMEFIIDVDTAILDLTVREQFRVRQAIRKITRAKLKAPIYAAKEEVAVRKGNKGYHDMGALHDLSQALSVAGRDAGQLGKVAVRDEAILALLIPGFDIELDPAMHTWIEAWRGRIAEAAAKPLGITPAQVLNMLQELPGYLMQVVMSGRGARRAEKTDDVMRFLDKDKLTQLIKCTIEQSLSDPLPVRARSAPAQGEALPLPDHLQWIFNGYLRLKGNVDVEHAPQMAEMFAWQTVFGAMKEISSNRVAIDKYLAQSANVVVQQ